MGDGGPAVMPAPGNAYALEEGLVPPGSRYGEGGGRIKGANYR